mgnify:CR=1 FL=1
MARLFGTDGVRGVANTELTGELAFRLGRAGAYVLTKETKHAPRILVAMDTRISGDMLESAVIQMHPYIKSCHLKDFLLTDGYTPNVRDWMQVL